MPDESTPSLRKVCVFAFLLRLAQVFTLVCNFRIMNFKTVRRYGMDGPGFEFANPGDREV